VHPPRRILTKNRMGWSSEQLSPLTAASIDWCREHKGARLLDIGSGHGAAARAALDAGAIVIANDIAAPALEPHERLAIRTGRFPRHLHFEPESLDAVHIAGVLHFLTGRQLEEGFRAIARWLRPEGMLFTQAATPSLGAFPGFRAEHERRRQAGEKWPGWIAKVSDWSSHRQRSQMPKSIHLLDEAALAQLAAGAGLHIEKLWSFPRPDLPASLRTDGRETVALIARR
jgi:SAM-dependent methyltransferase